MSNHIGWTNVVIAGTFVLVGLVMAWRGRHGWFPPSAYLALSAIPFAAAAIVIHITLLRVYGDLWIFGRDDPGTWILRSFILAPVLYALGRVVTGTLVTQADYDLISRIMAERSSREDDDG